MSLALAMTLGALLCTGAAAHSSSSSRLLLPHSSLAFVSSSPSCTRPIHKSTPLPSPRILTHLLAKTRKSKGSTKKGDGPTKGFGSVAESSPVKPQPQPPAPEPTPEENTQAPVEDEAADDEDLSNREIERLLRGRVVPNPNLPDDMNLRHNYVFMDYPSHPMRAPWPTNLEALLASLEAAVPHAQTIDQNIFDDFVRANFHLLGMNGARGLTTYKLRAQATGDIDRQREFELLRAMYLKSERILSQGFVKYILLAEDRLATNRGDTNFKKFIGDTSIDVSAFWVVIQAALSSWETKFNEKLSEVQGLGEDKTSSLVYKQLMERELSKIVFNMQIFQNVTDRFSASNYATQIRTEMKFIDTALRFNNSVAIREYAMTDFCENNNITPSELRRKIRCLRNAVSIMSPDSYLPLYDKLDRVVQALSYGTEEELDWYQYTVRNYRIPTYEFKERTYLLEFKDTFGGDTDDFTLLAKALGLPVKRKNRIERPSATQSDWFSTPSTIEADLQREQAREQGLGLLDDAAREITPIQPSLPSAEEGLETQSSSNASALA